MAVVRVRRLHARHDVRRQHLQRPARRQREDLIAAHPFETVQPSIRLRHAVAGDEHAVVLHEDDRLVAHQRGQPLAFFERRGQAGVMVVVGDLAVEEGCRLAGRQQPVVLQHVQRHGPGLMGVQHGACAGDAVDRRVDALGRQFERIGVASRHMAVLVEDHELARACLRPVLAERQDEVLAVVSGQRQREVVVDAFVEFVQHGQSQRPREVDAGAGDGIVECKGIEPGTFGQRRDQRANGHGGLSVRQRQRA